MPELPTTWERLEIAGSLQSWVSVTASSVLRTSEAGHHRGSTTGNGTGVFVEDGDDVSSGKDHSEFEGELCGLVGGAQLAVVGGGAGLLKGGRAIAAEPGDFVVEASRLRSYLGC